MYLLNLYSKNKLINIIVSQKNHITEIKKELNQLKQLRKEILKQFDEFTPHCNFLEECEQVEKYKVNLKKIYKEVIS